jgi:hypothetical protein
MHDRLLSPIGMVKVLPPLEDVFSWVEKAPEGEDDKGERQAERAIFRFAALQREISSFLRNKSYSRSFK